MPVIAVDGPAASGKGTIARRLAGRFGYAYLDTGTLYRAVGLAVLRAGGDPADETMALRAAETLDVSTLDDPEIRGDTAAGAASRVAAIPSVRAALLAFQRRFAAEPPDGAVGAVLDGRDIGTVVCPEAAAKLFVTADVEVRADRRHRELISRGVESSYARVLADLQDRDKRDAERAAAPMRKADDAVLIDTTGLDVEQAVTAALQAVEPRVRG